MDVRMKKLPSRNLDQILPGSFSSQNILKWDEVNILILVC